LIQVTPQMRVLVALEPVDFRKGIDGLAQHCRKVLEADPFSGTVFVFRGRGHRSIKILVFDGGGFWLCTRRLSAGRFRWWPSRPGSPGAASAALFAHELHVLICGGDPSGTRVPPAWRPVGPNSGAGR
jgi:transposase